MPGATEEERSCREIGSEIFCFLSRVNMNISKHKELLTSAFIDCDWKKTDSLLPHLCPTTQHGIRRDWVTNHQLQNSSLFHMSLIWNTAHICKWWIRNVCLMSLVSEDEHKGLWNRPQECTFLNFGESFNQGFVIWGGQNNVHSS